ncbi:hypothetical protein JYQ62_20300 [Nostoc sp. UHCC 0702]|nr:hypothetical protein JYQ62_20300 [Nostoc sp. UHCC 0702]
MIISQLQALRRREAASRRVAITKTLGLLPFSQRETLRERERLRRTLPFVTLAADILLSNLADMILDAIANQPIIQLSTATASQ